MPARGALGTEVGGPRPGQRIRGSRQLARCCSWDSSAPTFTRGPDRRRGRAEQVSHAARSWAPSLRGAGPPRCAELGPLAGRAYAVAARSLRSSASPDPDARPRARGLRGSCDLPWSDGSRVRASKPLGSRTPAEGDPGLSDTVAPRSGGGSPKPAASVRHPCWTPCARRRYSRAVQRLRADPGPLETSELGSSNESELGPHPP
jgi:hypothetical protein